MEAWHHTLRKGVDRDLVNPFCKALTPVASVGLQGVLHGMAFHGMSTVVAVTNAIGTLDCSETHWELEQVFLT